MITTAGLCHDLELVADSTPTEAKFLTSVCERCVSPSPEDEQFPHLALQRLAYRPQG